MDQAVVEFEAVCKIPKPMQVLYGCVPSFMQREAILVLRGVACSIPDFLGDKGINLYSEEQEGLAFAEAEAMMAR